VRDERAVFVVNIHVEARQGGWAASPAVVVSPFSA
jgi:hypothetical protein